MILSVNRKHLNKYANSGGSLVMAGLFEYQIGWLVAWLAGW